MAKRQTEEEKLLSRIQDMEQQVAQAQSTVVRVVHEVATTNQQMLARVVTLLEGEQELRKTEANAREYQAALDRESAKFQMDKQQKLLVMLEPLLVAWMPTLAAHIEKLFNKSETVRYAQSFNLPLVMVQQLLNTMTVEQIEEIAAGLFRAQIAGMDRKTMMAARDGDRAALVEVINFVRELKVEAIDALFTRLRPEQVLAFSELHRIVSEQEQEQKQKQKQKKAAEPEPEPAPAPTS